MCNRKYYLEKLTEPVISVSNSRGKQGIRHQLISVIQRPNHIYLICEGVKQAIQLAYLRKI